MFLVSIPREKVQAKEPDLRSALQHHLEASQIPIIDQCLSLIDQTNRRIDARDTEIRARMKDQGGGSEDCGVHPRYGSGQRDDRPGRNRELSQLGHTRETGCPVRIGGPDWSRRSPSLLII